MPGYRSSGWLQPPFPVTGLFVLMLCDTAHCFVHLWLRVNGQRVDEGIAKRKEWRLGRDKIKKGRGEKGGKRQGKEKKQDGHESGEGEYFKRKVMTGSERKHITVL